VKTNLRFWSVVFVAVASIILGYFGFLAFAPDKTSGYLMALSLFCLLLALAGILVLVGALVYAIAKVSAKRKRPTEPAK
jgi:flagellar biogenesis protein FliO